MTDMVGAALLRRDIGRRFTALRKAAGLTQDQAAAAVQRGRGTIGRIEEGDEHVRFRDVDVKALLDAYDASLDDRDILLAMTAETRNGRKGWWHDYTHSALPDFFQLYVTLEDSADTIQQYEPELIPGLLQTKAYAEAVNRALTGYLSDEEIERRVSVRMERQSLLTRPRAPHLHVILSEAVLHRVGGGPEDKADQLQRLIDAGRQSNISIRIIPFDVGAHAGMSASNAFSLLDFPTDPATGQLLEPPLAYVDTLTGAMYLNKPDEIRAYRLVWQDLERSALDEESSESMITTILKGLTSA